jgi:uncharacterized protein (DUF608 family)
VYRGSQLDHIGMPIGGLCAGQIYLGGDGRLWLWDIFNGTRGTNESHYAHPLPVDSPVKHGFTLKLQNTEPIPLDRTGFPAVTFCGQYPIGTVKYERPDLPVAVTLEAFSPFVPLSTDDSSLPATVLRFTLTNRSAMRRQPLLHPPQGRHLLHSGPAPGLHCRHDRLGDLQRGCSVIRTPSIRV